MMEKALSKEQQYVVYGLVLFVVSGVVALGWQKFQEKSHVVRVQAEQGPAPSSAAGLILVQISGAVRSPGVYRFHGGSRILDALKAAGGDQPGSDLSSINLVEFLKDGGQVRIPWRMPVAAAGDASHSIRLNAATAEELDRLPGIGKSLSERIVSYRNLHGPFGSVEDLRKVSGIGAKMLVRLKDHLSL